MIIILSGNQTLHKTRGNSDYTPKQIAAEIKYAAAMARTECDKKIAQHAAPLTEMRKSFETDPDIHL